MVAHRLDPTPEFRDRVMVAKGQADGGDYAAAEATLRNLLAETRGRHLGNHAHTISALTIVYGRTGRYLEAHLMARRLAALAQEVGPTADQTLAFALGSTCGALSKLHLFGPLSRNLEALRLLLERVEDPGGGLAMKYHAAAATCAIETEDVAAASRHLRAYRSALEAVPDLPMIYLAALVASEAKLARHQGNLELAQALLGQLDELDKRPAVHRMERLPTAVAVEAGLGNRDAARAHAQEAIAMLESVQEEPFLASDRIHIGNEVSHELEAMGEVALAHRVHDLVAAAVLIRLRQVDECTRALPELGLADPESTAELTAFRRQFLSDQRALLGRVAKMLEARGDGFIRSLIDDQGPAGFITICAWCESARPADGRWLPIGHLIPREGSILVTHGVCPSCAERTLADLA